MAHSAGPVGTPDQSPLLVGRAHEQALLGQRLAAALAGRGNLVLIGGEAGIGKTALADAISREAAIRGARALVGRSYDLADTPPYGPWLDLFGRSPAPAGSPPLAALVQRGAASQEALFVRVREYTAALAGERPLLVVLDDLHWADPASLDLLRFLARDLASLPLLCLVAYRTDELSRDHPLYRLLPLLAGETKATRLDLRPLDAAAVRALVGARYRLPDPDRTRLATHLQVRAEGNPFFLGELLRDLEEEGLLHPAEHGWALGELGHVRVPPFVRQVIDGRLGRLGEEARRLLATAAVIGQEAPLALWGTVSGVAEEALLALLERAVEMRLLQAADDGASVRFVHALIREALYDGLLPPRRRAWHRRVGERLLETPAPDPDAVAYHFRQAGDERAAEWLVKAGEGAQRSYAWLTAADRYEAALTLLERRGAGAPERGWLLYRLASLRRYATPRRALAALDRAVQLGRTADDRALVACATFNRGHLRGYVGDIRGALADMEAGVAAMGALPPADAARLATLQDAFHLSSGEHLLGTLAAWLAMAGRFAEARAHGERATAALPARAAQHLWDGFYAADGYWGLGLVHAAMGRPREAREAFGRARDGYSAIDHHLILGAATLYELVWVVLPYRADDPDERRRLAKEAAQALALASGLRDGVPPHLAYLPLLLLEGGWAEARRLALAERAAHEAVSWWRGLLASILVPLAREQGETDLAWDVVRETVPEGVLTPPGEAMFAPTLIVQRTAAAVAIDTGDLATARAWLEAHDRWLAWSGAARGLAEGQLGWAVYHRAAGSPALAHKHAARALEHASQPRQPLALLAAHRLLGELETTVRRYAAAATHLGQALALADACAAPYERAQTLLALAELRRATGKRAEARALLDEVRAMCAPLGAALALARADALAAALEGGASARSSNPDGLTAREVEVLRLVAAGLTDVQVAERLVVSPHTVHVHLRSIYGKLGVSSRSAATRYALEHHLG